MGKKTYPIPEGVKSITVISDVQNNLLTIEFGGLMPGDFFCKQTDEYESTPREKDLAILWNSKMPEHAVVSALKEWESTSDGIHYYSMDDKEYDNAIRFRSEEQYRKITGIYG